MAKRGVHGAHQEEGGQIGRGGSDPHRATDDHRRPHPHRADGDGVADVVDPAQLLAQFGTGHSVVHQPIGGEHLGSCPLVRDHGGCHGSHVTFISQMMQDSKVTPLTARSVLASALLGEDPPELPVAHLVQLAGLFGISDNRARVALSRMVTAGEATTDGSGRYRLAGHLLDRQGRQIDSRRGETRQWAGRMAPGGGDHLGSGGRGPAGPAERPGPGPPGRAARGVWLRPDNIDLVPDPADDPHVTTFTAVPDGDPAALAAGLWDLGDWARRARELSRPAGGAAHHPARPTWPPGSSCPPPSSATSRPTRCCPSSCCLPTGPDRRCDTPTIGGTGSTEWC